VSKGTAFHLMALFFSVSSILKCSSIEGAFYFREEKKLAVVRSGK
jgi:hypothetical protein